MKGIIVVDVERCMGCKSCELECAVAHSKAKSLIEALLEEPRPVARVTVEAIEGYSLPMQCRHCEDPPCVAVCPSQALTKLGVGEPVVLKNDRCIGCKMCILICPFGVMALSRDGKVITKCDLCIERLEEGHEPACVRACPTHSLRYMSVEEALKEKRTTAAKRYLVELRKGGSGEHE
jgi:carbon-monoxide dehydrogenase iron sulfur subunit